jgi:hypothetical protein
MINLAVAKFLLRNFFPRRHKGAYNRPAPLPLEANDPGEIPATNSSNVLWIRVGRGLVPGQDCRTSPRYAPVSMDDR